MKSRRYSGQPGPSGYDPAKHINTDVKIIITICINITKKKKN